MSLRVHHVLRTSTATSRDGERARQSTEEVRRTILRGSSVWYGPAVSNRPGAEPPPQRLLSSRGLTPAQASRRIRAPAVQRHAMPEACGNNGVRNRPRRCRWSRSWRPRARVTCCDPRRAHPSCFGTYPTQSHGQLDACSLRWRGGGVCAHMCVCVSVCAWGVPRVFAGICGCSRMTFSAAG